MLTCTVRYINPTLGIVAEPGDVLDLAPDLEAHLLRDAPGCWERPAAVTVPARDRMVRNAGTRKGAARVTQT